MIRADLLITGIGELATLSNGPVPRVGAAMEELSRLHGATVAAAGGRIAFIGPDRAAAASVRLRSGGTHWEADGGTVVPGFVDAHTHVLFAGSRVHEIALKVRGASYVEIAHAGGGLYSTVRATREATESTVRRETAARLRRMLRSGTTSAEVKSGYALDHEGELRLLRAIPRLARESGLTLVPTFLGAHAVPPEFAGRADRYVDRLVRRTLPVVARERLARFCDVFCEPGFFTLTQAERILRAAAVLGLGLKVHAEEFVYSGGARLAARLSATSAEHLLVSRPGDWRALAKAGVTAVLLPVTPFASLSGGRSPGRELVDAGVPVALGTDLSPNSWVTSMPIVMTHAVYSGRLTPAEALSAATVNAAHASGLADRAGTIALGRPADLLLFDAPDIEHVVYRHGTDPVRISRQGTTVLLT